MPVPAVKPVPVAQPVASRFPPAAKSSRMGLRHHMILISFVLAVLVPFLVSAVYLWGRAADQYASTLGFSVHREELSSAISILSGISSISGSSSTDTDILYEYIFSQKLVEDIDKEMDLRAIWSKAPEDFVFSYQSPGKIEDLVEYWSDMVSVHYNSSTRLIEVQVRAFDPVDAQAIATAIFDRSSGMINELNDIAAADAIRYTAEELERTEADLWLARQSMTNFRIKYQVVDPATEMVTASGLVAALEQQLSSALVDLDVLKGSASAEDPRIPVAERRIKVIENRISEERSKVTTSIAGQEGEGYAAIVAEFESLSIDRLFAEEAHRAARAAHEIAKTEARRQSRYLAAHVQPTLAQSPRYPARMTNLMVVASFCFMLWAIAVLIYYSLRDRR